MAYKLLALDLDDTLLDSNGVCPAHTLSLLNQLKANGVYICIATGRSYAGVKRYADLIQPNAPIITYVGAEIHENDKTLFSSPVSAKDTKALFDFAKQNKLYLQVYLGDDYCFETHTKYSDIYESFYGFPGREIPGMLDMENIVTPKVLFICEANDSIPLQNELIAQFPDLTIMCSRPQYVECLHKNASKGNALRQIAEYLHIQQNEIVAIGDSQIDISMIEYAGLGVAVENARKEVKNAADFITRSNNAEGVAYVIERFF